ncbi:MAG TPA: chemotaxis response regulator protein-glutamate methylesterase [Candidatus Ozemobacteraceae bacterium]|nr:chemotaxis response regulator protein-glutamate methylesterase [Candidatus Ozemobacteraceae bacterium]
MALKVLVVDDTVLFRKLLSEALTASGEAEVVGSASGGFAALARIKELKPDLITLDIEMPGMDGLQVLDAIKRQGLECGVIVVSALTRTGGKLTISALEKGAFDFVTKPEGASIEESLQSLTRSLSPIVRAFKRRFEIRSLLTRPVQPVKSPPITATQPAGTVERTVSAPGNEELARINERMRQIGQPGRPKMILIGVSTGGPNALGQVLPQIPAGIGIPVFIVQHMPPLFTQPLAESLHQRCKLSVQEASDGEIAQPDNVYIAPGGRHMRIKNADNQITIEITDDPPENNCRPAVDYLFRSAAHNFAGQAVAVVLTGMGNDGLTGVKLLKRHGCYTIAQDEASCVVFGMPRAIVEAGLADAVLPLESIAAKITALTRGVI